MIENTAALTRSDVGRNPPKVGVFIERPLCWPPLILVVTGPRLWRGRSPVHL